MVPKSTKQSLIKRSRVLMRKQRKSSSALRKIGRKEQMLKDQLDWVEGEIKKLDGTGGKADSKKLIERRRRMLLSIGRDILEAQTRLKDRKRIKS